MHGMTVDNRYIYISYSENENNKAMRQIIFTFLV